jgi:hypothetical protein
MGRQRRRIPLWLQHLVRAVQGRPPGPQLVPRQRPGAAGLGTNSGLRSTAERFVSLRPSRPSAQYSDSAAQILWPLNTSQERQRTTTTRNPWHIWASRELKPPHHFSRAQRTQMNSYAAAPEPCPSRSRPGLTRPPTKGPPSAVAGIDGGPCANLWRQRLRGIAVGLLLFFDGDGP